MTSAFELITCNRQTDYGEFITGLFVMEGSSSDDFGPGDPAVTAPVRDVLTAVPVLRWTPNPGAAENLAEAATMLQAKAIGAIKLGESLLPMTLTPSSRATFLLDEDGLRIHPVNGQNVGLFDRWTFHITDRLRWFLENGKTLSIQIMSPSGDPWVTSLTIGANQPMLAVQNGSIAPKARAGIINHSRSWTFAHLGNVSLFPDAREVSDHHYRTYGATPQAVDIPNITYHGPCLGCGALKLTREHCIPDWISRDLNVMPVTANIFCEGCNSYFGQELEKPIASSYRLGTLLDTETRPLFIRWAIKTALTLAAASNVPLAQRWMYQLRKNTIPKGFEVFADMTAADGSGYSFAVSHFSAEDREREQFLTSFVLGEVSVVVAHSASHLNKIPHLRRIHPSTRPADAHTGGQTPSDGLHQQLLSRITGSQLGFVPSKMKDVRPRQPRSTSKGT